MRWILAISLMLPMVAFAQYHAGSGKCGRLERHVPSADLEARDGFDRHGNPVVPADMAPNNLAKQFDNSNIRIDIPVTNYLDQDKYNTDLSDARIQAGTVSVMKDGSTALNGQPLTQQDMYSTECQ